MSRLTRMATVVACAVMLSSAFSVRAEPQKKGGKDGLKVTGCLRTGTEANTFMLTNVGGGGSYELIAASGVNLAPHVGHKIEVTGTSLKPNKAAKMEGEKGAAKKGERAERHLEVRAVRMIAASCP